MSGILGLDWAALAVSLFNTVLLLWLGLTVVFNAERRSWGMWLSGGGLLTGAIFFVSHSAILGIGLSSLSQDFGYWWRLGWLPLILLPVLWYVIILWYSGYWEATNTPLRRRQRRWLVAAGALAAFLLSVLVLVDPQPSFSALPEYPSSGGPSSRGITVLVLTYPFFILLCTSLSLDALRDPGPSARVMGELARRRARPWLVGTSIVLLVVSLLVSLVMFWVVLRAQRIAFDVQTMHTLAWFDLVIAGLLALAIILLGQAVVAYEIFTGVTLPRGGLRRSWRRTILLSGGYGVLVGGGFALGIQPVYSLLLTTTLMTGFYALINWRFYAERDRHMRSLRPLLFRDPSDEFLDRVSATPEAEAKTPFEALCNDVLDTQSAALVPIGPLSPFVRERLTYPAVDSGLAPNLLPVPVEEISAQFTSPESICVPIRFEDRVERSWAIPLWGDRGLIGLLILGAKKGGGLYTQEEIEIARTVGERLIDAQISKEMASRLMGLQRQRLVESKVLDGNTRRVLHDEILPRLHAAMLELNTASIPESGASSSALNGLAEVHRQISDLLRDMPALTDPEFSRQGLIRALRDVIDVELPGAFDSVEWEIAPEADAKAQSLPQLGAEVMFYAAREAIRNAARHARGEKETTPLQLGVAIRWDNGLEIVLEDNGVGMEALALETGNQGLALHNTMMAVVGGWMSVDSQPGAYTRVSLKLPENRRLP